MLYQFQQYRIVNPLYIYIHRLFLGFLSHVVHHRALRRVPCAIHEVLIVNVNVLVAQSCLTLCDPVDCSPPGSSVRGILQARILEWVVIPFSRRSSQPRDQTWVSCTAGRFCLSEPPSSHQLATIYIESIVYMLLLLLNRFSRVRLCVTPQMEAHQAPLSLGFSRQEHWSGLPVPSPMHESEIESEAAVLSDSQRPYGLQPTRLLHPWDCPGKSTGVGCHCLIQLCIYVNPKKDVVYTQ